MAEATPPAQPRWRCLSYRPRFRTPVSIRGLFTPVFNRVLRGRTPRHGCCSRGLARWQFRRRKASRFQPGALQSSSAWFWHTPELTTERRSSTVSRKVKSSKNPGVRRHVGNAVEASAKVVNHPAIKDKLDGFLGANGQLVAADQRVESVASSLEFQNRAVAVTNDTAAELIERLAGQLGGDGMPRKNPFGPLGLGTPSALKRATGDELVNVTAALANAVVSRAGLSEATVSTAKRLHEVSDALARALKALPALENDHEKAVFERDAVARAWDKKLRALRLAAKSADEEGAGNLHEQLFGSIDFSHRRAPDAAPEPTPPPEGAPKANVPPAMA